MKAQNELLDAIQILIDKTMKDRATKVTGGKVKSASGGLATVTINGYDYSIPYSGTAPTVNSTVRVFIPNGNMSDAFIGGGGGGGGSTGTTNYNSLTNKPTINNVVLQGNKTSAELGVYGTGNEPPYPVTSVNGQTGDVTINTDGKVTSVNGETGDVVLNAESVGALPSTTKIPTATSDLTNDSGYITADGAPVQSVDGQTGAVTTNAVKTTAQSLTDAQKSQARTNIGAGTSSFSGAYDDLTGKPTIPSKTSELDNDEGFITDAALEPYAKTADVPTKTSQLSNNSGFITSDDVPVKSVNGETGAVVLTQDDVGDGTTYVRTHNDFTDAAKQQINTNEDNIAMLDSDMEAVQGDITTLKGNVTTLTNALGSKQDKITGGASTIADDNLTANRALVSDGNGKVAVSNVTATELGYLDGVTSNVQTQLDKKLESAPVTSVNSKTGTVTLSASDVGAVATSDVTQTLGTSTTKVPSEKAVADALSGAGAGDMLKATYDPTGAVADAGGIPDYVEGQLPTVNDATLTIQKNGMAVGTFTANASADKSINITMTKGDVGLSNVDNVKQYSASNPPPYPVTSVAGKTGDVELAKGDVGLGNVDNVKQYSASNPPPYPVTSVNGQTGAVEIDVGGGGVQIVLSSTQPSGLKAGDYWYQIIS